MNKVPILWLTTHVTPTDGYNNNVPFDVHYCYKCNLKIQEDLYGKYVNDYEWLKREDGYICNNCDFVTEHTYKRCPRCGQYMRNGVDELD